MFYLYTNVLFKSSVEVSFHYEWASKDRPVVPETPASTKRKKDQSLCPILCSEPLCSDIFDTKEELEKHILENNHSFSIINTSIDLVRSKFITKMKLYDMMIFSIKKDGYHIPGQSSLLMTKERHYCGNISLIVRKVERRKHQRKFICF